MTAWNGEADRYVTADKDTWVANARTKKADDPYAYLKDAELTEDLVKGAVGALRYAASIVSRKCFPSDVGIRLSREADAIEAEWERRNK